MVADLYDVTERALHAEAVTGTSGLLQLLDPRVKVAGLAALVLATIAAQRLWVILALFGVAVLLALASSVSLVSLAKRVWGVVLVFTGLVVVPALFLVPGEVIARLPGLDWAITREGLRSAVYVLSRAETAATFCLLATVSTPWTHVLKALRVYRVPVVFVVMLGMTHRYIFLLLKAACEMFESRRSRTVGAFTAGERRRLAVGAAGVLLNKSVQLSDEVYLAMQSRGYRGEVHILHEFRMKRLDWVALPCVLALAGLAVWVGR